MSYQRPPSSELDFALAQILLEAASMEPKEPGEPVTAEELAVFVEGHAETTLGSKRHSQIICQLSRDDDLYTSWLELNELYHAEPAEIAEESAATAALRKQQGTQAIPSKPARSPSNKPTLSEWFADLFKPQMAFAAILSAVATATLFSAITPDHTDSPTLGVTEGDDLPVKAQIEQYDADSDAHKAANALADWFDCLAIQGQSGTQLCYSQTMGLQHWMISSEGGTVSAIEAPIAADRIINAQLAMPLLAVSYQTSGISGIGVFKLEANNQSFDLQTLYEDYSDPGGFFDDLQLSPTRLTYNKVSGSGTKQAKQFVYEGEHQ